MKSELTIGHTKLHSFPLLARYKSTISVSRKFCVLFTSEKRGAVVWRAPECDHQLGDHTDGWASCFNTVEWEILPPGSQIVITQ